MRTTTLATTLLVGVLTMAGCTNTYDERTRFASPESAVDTLVTAIRQSDHKNLQAILGPQADAILSSGDAVADRQNMKEFLAAYDKRHKLSSTSNDTVALSVGDDDWPLPIPLVKAGGAWVFATEDGVDEMLSRRIGENELDAQQVCLAIVDAQREYARTDPDGDGVPDYAERILSEPGKKNGLYFPTAAGETASPLGPLVAAATDEGYKRSESGEPRPYHGYYYRLLTSQGSHATGGARDYKVNGIQIGGFAVIAWPAEVGNSGVMTFIVNQDGDLYQHYLGRDTDRIARALTTYDPGPGWSKVKADQ